MNLAQQGHKSTSVGPEMNVATTLSILILSKTYPTMGIHSPLSRHARLSGCGLFAEKRLRVDPYFQYFSSVFYIDESSTNICKSRAIMVNIEY